MALKSESPHRPSPWLVAALGLICAGVAPLSLLLAMPLDPESRVLGRPARFGAEGPITELQTLVNEPVKSSLPGRHVVLRGSAWRRWRATMYFGLDPGAGKSPWVLLDELTQRQGEQRLCVRTGDESASTASCGSPGRAILERRIRC